jgi:hypothetical protein
MQFLVFDKNSVAEPFANYEKKFRRKFRNSGPEFRLLVTDIFLPPHIFDPKKSQRSR